jgi:hypothetical protein
MIFDSLATILFVATSTIALPAHSEHLSLGTSASPVSSGCGSTTAWLFDTNNHITVTTGARSFLVHIPVAYDANTPHAVVFSFHGYKGNGLQQELISGFSEKGLRLNGKVRVIDRCPNWLLTYL